MEVDHVQPLEAGGAPWSLDNLQSLCRRCHLRKTERERLAKQPPDVRAWRLRMEARAAVVE